MKSLPADLAPLVLDVRHFTAWEGAQLGYWNDSGPHNIKTPAGEPDEFGPLSHTSVCTLVLQCGAVALGSAGPAAGPDALARRIAALSDAVAKARTLLHGPTHLC